MCLVVAGVLLVPASVRLDGFDVVPDAFAYAVLLIGILLAAARGVRGGTVAALLVILAILGSGIGHRVDAEWVDALTPALAAAGVLVLLAGFHRPAVDEGSTPHRARRIRRARDLQAVIVCVPLLALLVPDVSERDLVHPGLVAVAVAGAIALGVAVLALTLPGVVECADLPRPEPPDGDGPVQALGVGAVGAVAVVAAMFMAGGAEPAPQSLLDQQVVHLGWPRTADGTLPGRWIGGGQWDLDPEGLMSSSLAWEHAATPGGAQVFARTAAAPFPDGDAPDGRVSLKWSEVAVIAPEGVDLRSVQPTGGMCDANLPPLELLPSETSAPCGEGTLHTIARPRACDVLGLPAGGGCTVLRVTATGSGSTSAGIVAGAVVAAARPGVSTPGSAGFTLRTRVMGCLLRDRAWWRILAAPSFECTITTFTAGTTESGAVEDPGGVGSRTVVYGWEELQAMR